MVLRKALLGLQGALVLIVIILIALRYRRTREEDVLLRSLPASAIAQNPRYVYIDRIIKGCGMLCAHKGGAFWKGKFFFPERAVNVDCAAIFSPDVFIQRGHGEASAPREIPPEWRDEFTLGGTVRVSPRYFDNKYLGSTAATAVWPYDLIEKMIVEARNESLVGTYNKAETQAVRQAIAHAPGVVGGRVLVIGSETPWVEALALEAGARHVTTLEYGKIESRHPNVTTLLPAEFQRSWSTMEPFDAVVTYSSVEHSGLGRYGDALNPWGDVLEIARAWCVSKPGASLTIGVMYGGDAIEFNAHRYYGRRRLPYLFSNWHQHWQQSEGVMLQRLHVLTKFRQAVKQQQQANHDLR